MGRAGRAGGHPAAGPSIDAISEDLGSGKGAVTARVQVGGFVHADSHGIADYGALAFTWNPARRGDSDRHVAVNEGVPQGSLTQ